jgi:prepilin-type processing-associated H-X9-DG protein
MEQGNIYNNINFANTGNAASPNCPQNNTVQVMSIAAFLCPSDDDRLTSSSGHINYAADNGSQPQCFGKGTPDGLFGHVGTDWSLPMPPSVTNYGPDESIVRIAMVTDGTSNTGAFSERVKGTGQNNSDMIDTRQPSGTSAKVLSPSYPGDNVVAVDPFMTNPAGYNRLCMASGPGTPSFQVGPSRSVGGFWYLGVQPYGANFNHAMGPNTWSCSSANGGHLICGAWTASSRHPGGVNVGFADGSVRFVKSSVALNVWWALGTRAGGEVVSSDSY